MNLDEVQGDIHLRDIFIYGDASETEEFIKLYNSKLRIKKVVTDHKSEVVLQQYKDYGIETVFMNDVLLSDELIVICDSVGFDGDAKRLRHLGRKEYIHYISRELVEGLLYGKRLMVCMGTQLIRQTLLLLEKNVELLKKYHIVYFPEDSISEPYMNRLQEYIHLCRKCDVYIRSSCEKEKFNLKVRGKKTLNSNCKIISIADYGFAGYFPQYERDRDIYSELLLREKERVQPNYETLAFGRKEQELEAKCFQKQKIVDMVDDLLREDYFSRDFVLENFDNEIQRFIELEKSDSIKLGDFIKKNSHRCLCRNLNEWNEPVVSYVAEEILKQLQLPELRIPIEDRQKIIEQETGSEFLIYPSVQVALQLREQLKNKKYRVTTYYKVRYLKEREYLTFLAEYCLAAIDLVEHIGCDEALKESIMKYNETKERKNERENY